MIEIINSIVDFIRNIGPVGGFLLIILESMIPILPLGIFIGINTITFGKILGFLVSYAATIIGCILMFFICRKFNNIVFRKYNNNLSIKKIMKRINNISFSNLVLLVALPFTPAFLINVGAGLSNINFKKYFLSIIIGKISVVYFWGFIGKSFLESFSDFNTIIQISMLLILSFIVSKIFSKHLKI